jgi:hypothetical protein
MGGKSKEIDERVSPGPSAYNIPSKLVESAGKSMGVRLKGSMDATGDSPGPGAYLQDKAK